MQSFYTLLDLIQTSDGVVFSVRAQPGARANVIRGEHSGAIKVSVTHVAEKGKANRAILELLARSLNLKKSQIELLSGETAPNKKFLVRGFAPDELQQRIRALLD